MSILIKKQIEYRLTVGNESKDKIVVTPILSSKQIGPASIDVRLGNQFIVFRRHMLGTFQPLDTSADLKKMQERQIIRFGKPFVLHPGMLALGSTFEYIKIPSNLCCAVEGRSSWARLGLQIATATTVEPGFKGVLTLELSNVGTIPIELYPGVRIAQIIFFIAEAADAACYGETRKYSCPVGPEFSQIEKDEDSKFFKENH